MVETMFSEDLLNQKIIPQRVKDEETVRIMDKMSKVIKLLNGNGDKVSNSLYMKIPREKIEDEEEEVIIDMLRNLGVSKVTRWKLIPPGYFEIFQKEGEC